MKTSTRSLYEPANVRIRPYRLFGEAFEEGDLPVQGYPRVIEKEVITPNSEPGRRWKSFSHYKRWEEGSDRCHAQNIKLSVNGTFPYVLLRVRDQGDCDYGSCVGAEYGLGGLTPFIVEGAADAEEEFIPPPSNLSDLERMALKAMSPKIRAQLSLLNSLYELKDFRTLGKSYERLSAALKSLNFKAKGSITMRRLLHASADGYLQMMFNIRPLLSDIAGFHRAMSSSLKRLRAQAEFEGRPQIAHFGYKWNEYLDVDDYEYRGRSSGTGIPLVSIPGTTVYDPTEYVFVFRKVINSPTTFHAQMRYVVRHPFSVPAELARGFAILDGLGVNLNPAIIWNAIPYSFIVDWFVRVGQYLDGFKVGLSDPQIEVQQYLWSVKRKRVIERHVHYPTWVSGNETPLPTYSNGTEYIRIADIHETAYRRQVGIPDPSLFSTSGLSLTELSLGLALGVSKVLGSKRKPVRKPTNWRKVLIRKTRRKPRLLKLPIRKR